VTAKLARFSWLPGGLAAALVIAVGRLVFSTSSAPLELGVYDRIMRARSVAPVEDVVIVSIDDESIARLGEWPWPRDVHASLLNRLRADDARVVAFTVPFDTSRRTSELERLRAALALLEASNLGNSEQAQQLRRMLGESAAGTDPNAHLAQAMAAHGNVVLPIELRIGEQAREPLDLPTTLLPVANAAALRQATSGAVVQPLAPVFASEAAAVGHTSIQPDDDGTVRSELLAVRVSNALVPSLAAAIVARASGATPNQLTFNGDGQVRLAGQDVLTEHGLRVRAQYFSPDAGPDRQTFSQYPYWRVLSGEVPSASLRDKVVLVGFMNNAVAANAQVGTPVSNATPPVVATASAVSSLLSATVYARPAMASVLEWIVAAAVVAFAAFALPAFGVALGALASVLIIVILAVSEVGLLTSTHMWVRFMAPCVAVVAGYIFYLIAELLRRAYQRNESPADAAGNLRSLGQTFQRQGQLDLAFETYRRCPLDAATMELLYFLGMDFERRAQLQKAAAVYAYIETRDPNYRDLRNRRARVREEPLTRAPATRTPPAPVYGSDTQDEERSAVARTTSGRTLGRYEIERELGKGAMGTVYLGRDPKINRVVAIKAIPLAEEFEEEDLAEARARFFREAEMAGRLNHPAIVTVYDAGEDQGLAYIAMEYLRGQHLSHYTDPARLLAPHRVMLLIARVAEALHYAHRQNVVHRDIKPANIMFDPDTDELKITDFGIARLTDTSRTKTGIVLGTPSFMSPEQLEGRPLDGRSDQFALGISLYHLLCGRLPFRAESMPRLMQKIATEPHASVRVVRPELPEGIDAILDRVLAKSADDRYANCAEFAAALRACAGAAEAPRTAEPQHEWLIP
jgi:eukaryotic-like serine/threonine-protein kinase